MFVILSSQKEHPSTFLLLKCQEDRVPLNAGLQGNRKGTPNCCVLIRIAALKFWKAASDHQYHSRHKTGISSFLTQKTNPTRWQCTGVRLKLVWGTWAVRLVECPTLAQVVISRFVGLSPAVGSTLLVWSLLGIVPLCPSPTHTHVRGLSLKSK